MDYFDYLNAPKATPAPVSKPDLIEPDAIMVAEYRDFDDAPEALRAHFAHLIN